VLTVFGAEGLVDDVDDFLRKIGDFSTKHRVVIQVFNADLVYGRNHVFSAAEHALRAFREGANSMRSLAMETVLYAAGERQIGVALSKMGVEKSEESRCVFLVISSIPDFKEANGFFNPEDLDSLIGLLGLKRDDSVLEGNEDTLRRFGLSDEEIRTVEKDKYEDLILEKVAMVDVIK